MNSESLSRRNLIAGSVCAVAMAGAAAAGSRAPQAQAAEAPDFQGFYDGLDKEEQECCTVYADGSGMLIDTNPDDFKNDSDYEATLHAYDVIDKAFDEFGLPQIISGMFGQCSASDGWQSRTRNNFEITWKYYPDAGLRVFIEWLG